MHCTHTFPSTITPITQLSPFTHQPWLFHHTCTSFTHTHISSSLPCTHREVLFFPGWHSESFPCFLIPCVYLDCLFTLTVCCLPFWPCLPVDIFSVCCLPRPLHCPCCWFCLAFIIPVTAFDPCLFDLLSEIKLLLDLTSLPHHYINTVFVVQGHILSVYIYTIIISNSSMCVIFSSCWAHLKKKILT